MNRHRYRITAITGVAVPGLEIGSILRLEDHGPTHTIEVFDKSSGDSAKIELELVGEAEDGVSYPHDLFLFDEEDL